MNYHRTREKAGTVMRFGKGINNTALASTSFSTARQAHDTLRLPPPYPAWQNEPRKTSDRKLNRPTLDHTCYRMQLGSLLHFILCTKPSRFLDMLSQTMTLSRCPENMKRISSCNTMCYSVHFPPMQQYAAVGNIFSLSSKLLLYFLASITKM